MTLVIDASLPPADLAAAVRDRSRAIDPLVPARLDTMEAHMAAFVEPARFRARLLGALAGVALLLSVIGTAGVVEYAVARRRQEIGIRMALGATAGAVVRLIVRGGMLPVLAGVAVGLVAAITLARGLSSFLFGVDPRGSYSSRRLHRQVFCISLPQQQRGLRSPPAPGCAPRVTSISQPQPGSGHR